MEKNSQIVSDESFLQVVLERYPNEWLTIPNSNGVKIKLSADSKYVLDLGGKGGVPSFSNSAELFNELSVKKIDVSDFLKVYWLKGI